LHLLSSALLPPPAESDSFLSTFATHFTTFCPRFCAQESPLVSPSKQAQPRQSSYPKRQATHKTPQSTTNAEE
jgi:hypothetical protein